MIFVKDLEFYYNKKNHVLNEISFQAEPGLCTAVLGNNGAGKSTLIKCLNRILEPQDGQILVEGKNVNALSRNDIAKSMAYVSQKNPSERVTVYDTVLLGRKPYIAFEPTKKDHQLVKQVLKRMSLTSFETRYVDELSGGEVQKVMLARALVQQPKVLLLDEPTSSLDLNNQYEVLERVREIAKEEQISVIIVIHDLNLALRYCDRFLFVKNRKILAYGDKKVVTPEIMKIVYGMEVAVEVVRGVPVIIPMPLL
ncbi:ABC transporter ATP-binding protein [Alkalibacter mobilis]|uniref:ABC transporter ATP-binding protein n=1 Tax=Alkalibacter mobilis TaxID=2787712 RepID=UPI00189C8CCC|nr:ABC transporter ATP-binding protein [Alkalibacter mobilis]MBF7097863.1 ABC transporter ATP-binding protein [Alkalibacter mobilis]